jgi:predicted RNase H-like HicB family nuclease
MRISVIARQSYVFSIDVALEKSSSLITRLEWTERVYRCRSKGSLQPLNRNDVTLDRDKDGIWVVECPRISGCISQGQSKEEALENIKDAIAACKCEQNEDYHLL